MHLFSISELDLKTKTLARRESGPVIPLLFCHFNFKTGVFYPGLNEQIDSFGQEQNVFMAAQGQLDYYFQSIEDFNYLRPTSRHSFVEERNGGLR